MWSPNRLSRAHIYIYICCCVRKWGAFLRFMRSTMLPFTRSIMGCAVIFTVFRGGSPDQLFSRVRKISAMILGHHAELSGMFRRSASLAIPHLKSFAAIPSVFLVQFGHTNRNVFLSHESQREIALV